MSQEYIERLEKEIRQLTSKLRSISMSMPVCNKCGGTALADNGSYWRCMGNECNWSGAKGSVSYKNVPR